MVARSLSFRGCRPPLIAGLVGFLLCAPFLVSSAHAQYSFCNKTSYALSAAIGYVDDEDLVTRGWWRLRSGQCKRVLSDRVQPGRYFVYAEAIPGHRGELRTWSGETPLCVQNDSLFTLRDQNSCTSDPRRQRRFLPVDVDESTDGTKTTEFVEESNFTAFSAEVAGVQRLLKDIGLYEGLIDGSFGGETKGALTRFVRQKGLGNAGAINETVIDALMAEANSTDSNRGFVFCNATMLPVWAAFAQPDSQSEEYTSSGWWRLESQDCAKVRRGSVENENFYVYGVMEADGRSVPLAGGDTSFCISTVQFEAPGDAPCEELGYETANFRRVEATNSKAWTFQFTPELFNPALAPRSGSTN
ncbi:hypothetical protein PB2503_03967 [Parvularcula bermudensis HTCC2503]|uniref:Peptidoglycan binding-like domain-containing protein n=1 Tax=Parvularcula bermudensis (strain ATCC BAA-594 / HTCC2503 / KCTC 12087) TaxID=314260 RepID=E0TE47_PARBH|nr:DUF1036 domain-containing protein [Parvularcula bermudensis]ADM08868.1 hypothetical protein PB2503_03967 [Parvularcula bermudensis HTCC2503]